jgi:hypothetical protein
MQVEREETEAPVLAEPWIVLVVRARSEYEEQPNPLYYGPLQASGFNLLTVHDQFEVLRIASRVSPRLIIVDLTRPNPAILDLIQTLKEERNTRDVPVLLVGQPPESKSEQPPAETSLGRLPDRGWGSWKLA